MPLLSWEDCNGALGFSWSSCFGSTEGFLRGVLCSHGLPLAFSRLLLIGVFVPGNEVVIQPGNHSGLHLMLDFSLPLTIQERRCFLAY
jgi:hypothetical protein